MQMQMRTCLWVFAVGLLHVSGTLHLTSTFSIDSESGVVAKDQFTIHASPVVATDWRKSAILAGRVEKSEERRTEAGELGSEDLGDIQALVIETATVEEAVSCQTASLKQFVEGSLNPYLDQVEQAERALKDYGFKLKIGYPSLHAVSLEASNVTMEDAAKARIDLASKDDPSSKYRSDESAKALYQWMGTMHDLASKQLVAYQTECPSQPTEIEASELNLVDVGAGNDTVLPPNSSALSGLDVETAAEALKAPNYELGWCDKAKCGCKVAGLEAFRKVTVQAPADGSCACRVNASITELEVDEVSVRADITQSAPIDGAAAPLYACSSAAKLQCLSRANDQIKQLQDQYLVWRTDQCLRGADGLMAPDE